MSRGITRHHHVVLHVIHSTPISHSPLHWACSVLVQQPHQQHFIH